MGSCAGILATGHPTEKLGGFPRRSHKPLINLAKHGNSRDQRQFDSLLSRLRRRAQKGSRTRERRAKWLRPLRDLAGVRRARNAGIATELGCHSFRATGITVYLTNGGLLEHAQQMAAHESACTTKLYDRRNDKVTLDEVERIVL
jgi:hypothetical protein